MAYDIDMIKQVYSHMADRVNKAREVVGKPLTLSEKKFFILTFGMGKQKKPSKEVKIT